MVEAGLEPLDLAGRKINLDRIERARRRRRAKMVVLTADPLAAREAIGAKENPRQIHQVERSIWRIRVRRRIPGERGKRRHGRQRQIARQRQRTRSRIDLVGHRPVLPVEIMRYGPYAGVRMLRDFVKRARRLDIRVRHFPRCLPGRRLPATGYQHSTANTMSGLPEHVLKNRAKWDAWADEYVVRRKRLDAGRSGVGHMADGRPYSL